MIMVNYINKCPNAGALRDLQPTSEAGEGHGREVPRGLLARHRRQENEGKIIEIT